MPDWRGILNRFRVVGPPGQAAPAAVPADRRSLQLDELAPVFAALAGTRDEAEALLFAARSMAKADLEHAERRATDLVFAAENSRDSVRAAAFTAAQAGTHDEIAARLAVGRQEAERVAQRARECRPKLVERAVAAAIELMAEDLPDPSRTRVK